MKKRYMLSALLTIAISSCIIGMQANIDNTEPRLVKKLQPIKEAYEASVRKIISPKYNSFIHDSKIRKLEQEFNNQLTTTIQQHFKEHKSIGNNAGCGESALHITAYMRAPDAMRKILSHPNIVITHQKKFEQKSSNAFAGVSIVDMNALQWSIVQGFKDGVEQILAYARKHSIIIDDHDLVELAESPHNHLFVKDPCENALTKHLSAERKKNRLQIIKLLLKAGASPQNALEKLKGQKTTQLKMLLQSTKPQNPVIMAAKKPTTKQRKATKPKVSPPRTPSPKKPKYTVNEKTLQALQNKYKF